MELRYYINIIWRRMWVIILTVVVTLAVVVIGTQLQTPIYQASTELRIATSVSSQVGYQDYMFADRLMNTYVEIATSSPVMGELMARLNLSQPPDVKVERLLNTELIKITVEDTDPQMASTIANTLADILISQSVELYTGGGKSSTEILGEQLILAKESLEQSRQEYQDLVVQTPAAPEKIEVAQQALNLQQTTYSALLLQYEQAIVREVVRANIVTIVEPAIAPLSPSKPRPILNYALGLVIGLFGGVGLVFLLENLDTTLYTMDEIESITKLTTLSKIPKAKRKQLDISQNVTSPFAEAYRNLAASIQLFNHSKDRKVLLVMSAEPRQGKSVTVCNLAYALAETGKNVVAVDCDLHLPRLHSLFRLSNQYGLRDVLERGAGLQKSMQKSQHKGVTVLTTGSLTNHPSKMLGSPKMAKLIDTLSNKFDYVLLDTPAILSFADVAVLAHYADGLIMVVRRSYARRKAVHAANKFLELFPDKVIGCIVNQAEGEGSYGYYHYQYKSDTRTKIEKPKKFNVFRRFKKE